MVTRQYNETMKSILPQSGIRLIEIPRLTTQENSHEYISASKVRKLMEHGKWQELSLYLPQTTIQYMNEHFYMAKDVRKKNIQAIHTKRSGRL